MGALITVLVLICAALIFTCLLVALINQLRRNKNRRMDSDYTRGRNECEIEHLRQYNQMLKEEIKMLRKDKNKK